MIPSKKSEINLIVDHAGLSELLKPFLTDGAFTVKESIKTDSLQRIYLPAATPVALAATEVNHPLPGLTLTTSVFQLEVSIMIPSRADLITLLHVITTLLVSTLLAQAHHPSPLQPVLSNATVNIREPMRKIFTKSNMPTQSPGIFRPSKVS